jgi:hypothetical protein
MNISISQIANGFVIAISSPKGNTAVYCKTFDEVIEHLKELGTPPTNVAEMPRN